MSSQEENEEFRGFWGEPLDETPTKPKSLEEMSAEEMFGPTPPGGSLPGTEFTPDVRTTKPGAKTRREKPALVRALDISQALTTPPKPRDFALPCLRIGTVGGLVSPGGAGKSMLALQLSLGVASGMDAVPGLRSRPGWEALGIGGVTYASFEDGEDDAAARLHGIWTYLGRDATKFDLDMARKNLTVHTLTGVAPPDLLDGAEWASWLDSACAGRRLVVLDTLRTSHMEDENDSGAMSRLLATLQSAALRHGCAVLFLHHTSKAAAMSGQGSAQQAARGSSVITDNARGQFHLSGMTEQDAYGENGRLFDRSAPESVRNISLDGEDRAGRPLRLRYARFGVSKSNYAAPWPDVWLRRNDGGVLSCADIGPPPRGSQGAAPAVPTKEKPRAARKA